MCPVSDSQRPIPDDKSESANAAEQLHVGHSIRERRLDKYLHARFSNLSRSFIQNAIKQGAVKVNGKIAKQSLKLSPGDIIDFTPPEPPSKDILPEDIPLDIIYEDEELIVHRLDKNTTGVMVVTKNDTAQWKIAKQFEHRQINKTYLAIVHGTPELTADCINIPLGIHPRFREKYAVRPESGKEAVTFYEVLEPFRGFSLLKLTPKTGRTHQIRVHLLYIKHPIVADDMYGGKLIYHWQLADTEPAVQEPILSRVALHAFSLEFTHPATNKMMKFEAPLPQDMQNLLNELRKYRSI